MHLSPSLSYFEDAQDGKSYSLIRVCVYTYVCVCVYVHTRGVRL